MLIEVGYVERIISQSKKNKTAWCAEGVRKHLSTKCEQRVRTNVPELVCQNQSP